MLQLPVQILAFLPVFGLKTVGKTDYYKTSLKGLILQKELPSNNIKMIKQNPGMSDGVTGKILGH